MQVIATENRPIKLWLDDIEDGALAQTRNLANLPFIFKHIAVMPDAHQGYGMPIGGVMATQGVVVPNAVGVDIGCGMCAVDFGEQIGVGTPILKEIMGKIREAVPVGFNKHKYAQDLETVPQAIYRSHDEGKRGLPIVEREFTNALKSVGTLGGGNHFIELQRDQDKHLWVMIHSGSRNLGKQVADHYNKVAIKLNEQYFSEVPSSWQLAFLPINSAEGQLYLDEMNYCVDFAFANRSLMMERIVTILMEYIPPSEALAFTTLNVVHNYAVMENHYGHNVMVHRKGATRAYEGQLGIIPGSQGSPSYIVEGKGNPASFKSCSHGAGRRMGRKQATRELSLVDEIEKLEQMGVLHSIRGIKSLDEAPGAYKNIEKVMASQEDLVEIKHTLTPLAVIKG